jgi:hypothetical protein
MFVPEALLKSNFATEILWALRKFKAHANRPGQDI